MGKAKASPRLYILIGLTASYMVAEIVVGYLVNSLALISDSFHMLSDVLALIVALWARRYSKKDQTETMTYGWRRAEVVGALANGVFLIALSINILIEAIQRFFQIEEVENPKLILIVGAGGLFVNLVGLLMFHDHGHSHSHGGHSHSHKKNNQSDSKTNLVEPSDIPSSFKIELPESAEPIEIVSDEPPPVLKKRKVQDLNMRGVFLHVLGDALGSVAVMASSLIIWLTSFKERYYIDPIISILITALILKSTIPLVMRASKILLQAVPEHVDIKLIKTDLEAVKDVVNIHEIHIWQLSNDLLVASLHITCMRNCNFMALAITLKAILHKHGIHATTIQPEFVDESELMGADGCILRCETKCEEQSCCTQRKTSKAPALSELPKHDPS
jgi:zinc transporter 1